MSALVLPEETKTTTTTLFELMSAMQQQATTSLDEAMIVPTVMDLLRNGRIRFERGLTRLSIADGAKGVPLHLVDSGENISRASWPDWAPEGAQRVSDTAR